MSSSLVLSDDLCTVAASSQLAKPAAEAEATAPTDDATNILSVRSGACGREVLALCAPVSMIGATTGVRAAATCLTTRGPRPWAIAACRSPISCAGVFMLLAAPGAPARGIALQPKLLAPRGATVFRVDGGVARDAARLR